MSQTTNFAPGDALAHISVLYVDGEAHRRDLMRQLLITLGASRIQLAETGAASRRIFQETTVGLLLVEQKLPDTDAIALIKALRAARNYPKALVPMLVIGEATSPEEVKASLAAGANHFVVKPVSPAKLYERMCWALLDTRPFAIKDGRYVLAPLKAASRSASNSPKSAAI